MPRLSPARLSPLSLALHAAFAATVSCLSIGSALAETVGAAAKAGAVEPQVDQSVPQGTQSAPQGTPMTPIPQVKIVGAMERGYTAKRTSTATKTDTLLRDTPQAITVITGELMQDQGVQNMADVIRYVPGIVTAQGEGNRDTVIFRGNSSTSDFYVDGMRDDVQYYRDFYNIDSVEAIKGPNAMIFGRGGSGGVINRVSKQPQWNDVREVSFSVGSNNARRATADLGVAVNDNVALRVNAMVEESDSFRDGVSVKRSGINPTLAIRVNADTKVVLGYEHFEDERIADRGIPSFNGKPFATDPSTFFGNADASPTWARVDAFSAVIDHDMGHGVKLRNSTRFADYDKFYQNVFPGAVSPDGNSVAISAYSNATARKNFFNQTDLTFSLMTGAIEHKFATGIELGRQVTDNFRSTGYFANNATSIDVPTSNPGSAPIPTFSQSATDADNHGTATVASVYLQDQITFSPQWQAIVGVRYDHFKVDFLNRRNNTTIVQTDTPLSPRAGLIYKPFEALSLYASYSRAFVPRAGEQLSSLTPSSQAFDPEQFKNMEVGAKWDIKPNLSATAALYQLDRSNVIIPLDNNTSVLADGQRSKGLELGLSGKLNRDWSMMGAYAYQDAKITETQSSAILAGARVAQVPKHTFSLWNRYDFTSAWGAGLGVIYRSSIDASTTNKVTLAGFTRFDGALYYQVNKDLALQVNLENMLDKQYFASAHNDNNITPGSPRAIRVGLSAKF
jgi:catecholate siderophore receptor